MKVPCVRVQCMFETATTSVLTTNTLSCQPPPVPVRAMRLLLYFLFMKHQNSSKGSLLYRLRFPYKERTGDGCEITRTMVYTSIETCLYLYIVCMLQSTHDVPTRPPQSTSTSPPTPPPPSSLSPLSSPRGWQKLL